MVAGSPCWRGVRSGGGNPRLALREDRDDTGPMPVSIAYPEIDHVLPPVGMDGTPTGAKPRKRHHPDCGHFTFPDGSTLGTPRVATAQELRALPPCKDCIDRTQEAAPAPKPVSWDTPAGRLCPNCFVEMPVIGQCYTCA